MASGSDEEEAGVYTQVALLSALRLLLLPHVDFVLVIDEVNDGCPGIAVVDVVAEARRVDDSKLHFEGLLLQLCLDDVDLRRFPRGQL